MRLYLVRHGLAVNPAEPNCPPDPKRFLTPEGIKKTRVAMLGLAALGVEPQVLVSSPYLRAVQTAELAAEALKYPADKIRTIEALLPGTAPGQLLRELARIDKEEVMCFGHAPNLDLVIAHCLGLRNPVTQLKKAGAAGLDLQSLSPVKASLLWLYTGKALRLLGEA